MNKKIFSTAQLAAILSVMAVISKLLGFVRELFLANYYGAGVVTDAYTMSLSIPNNLLYVIVGAAMTAYMPIFSRKVESSEEEGNLFTSQLINFLLAFTALAAVLGGIFAPQLVALFAPGYKGETAALTIFYTRFAFVMVIFSVFSNILGAYLEYKGSFIAQQVLNYAQNIAIIMAIIISAKTLKPGLLIFGITLGYIIMGLGKLWLASRNGYQHKFDFHFTDSVKDVMTMAIPVFLGNSLSEINAFVDRILASSLPEGTVSALNYGLLFSNVVSSFTVVILVTILYPRIAKSVTLKEYDKVSEIADSGLNLIVLIMMPIMLGSLIYSGQVVQVVYERGAFTADATKLTSTAFFFYSIAVVFTGVRTLLDRIYFALHDAKTSVTCSAVALAVNIVLNIVLVKPMGHAGLALATSISGIVAATMLYILFKKRHPEITLLRSFKKIGLIAIFSAISCGASYAVFYFVGNKIWMPRMVLLGLAVLVAVVIYFIFLYVAKFEELGYLAGLLRIKKREG